RLIQHVNGLVRAHRQSLADRLRRLGRAHRQDRHLAAVRLGDLQALLDRVLIQLVDQPVRRFPIQRPGARRERPLNRRIRHLLDADDDVHGQRCPFSVIELPATNLCYSLVASACSAASTTLASSIARVIGPTPPGIGASQPATSATSGATSPTSPASVRVMPTSSTAAPGLTMSAVSSPGRPAATTTMSAARVCAARSFVPVWHSVTVAFSERRVSSNPSARPTVMPRPTTVTSAPAISTPYRRSSTSGPCGVHGSGPSSPSPSLPRLTGCRPS